MPRPGFVVALVGVAGAGLAVAAARSGPLAEWVLVVSGYGAVVALAASLAIGLVRRLAPVAAAPARRWRRWCGMRAAELAVLHVAVALPVHLDWQLRHLQEQAWLGVGTCAAAILVVLWGTSWPRLVAGLRLAPVWRLVHAWVHLVPLLLAVHVAVGGRLGPMGLRVVVAVVGAWYALRFGLPPLRALVRRCAARLHRRWLNGVFSGFPTNRYPSLKKGVRTAPWRERGAWTMLRIPGRRR